VFIHRRVLTAAARDVQDRGGRPLVVPVDVADAEQIFAAADRIHDELGPVDVWVNVAFTSVFSPFEKISAAEYRRVTEVSYLGYVYGTMAALRRMKPRDRGTIVQVGSALAYRGIPLQTAYCGAKHVDIGNGEARHARPWEVDSPYQRPTRTLTGIDLRGWRYR